MTFRASPALAAACLVASFLALALAPLVVEGDYSVLANTTSESAGQGVGGAWMARAGFVLFGVGVLLLARLAGSAWSLATRVSLVTFAVAMIGAALWSSRPWDPDLPFDATEDLLHSIAATGMGFAFALGVVSRGVQRRRVDPLDAVATVASVVLPLGMLEVPDLAGVLQRTMFLVAYTWFARELASVRAQRLSTSR